MTRRLAPLALLLPVVVSCGAPRARPDVVLIVVDTLRADALGCYGSPEAATPYLDALARRGEQFRICISQAPWTLPAVATILSGHYPSVLGFDEIRTPLPASAPHLAEELRSTGYSTAGIVSNLYLRRKFGFDRGFDHYDTEPIGGAHGISSTKIVDAALDWLEDVRRPFFLFLHFMDPHHNYLEHEYFTRSEPYDGPLSPELEISAIRDLGDELGPKDLRYLRNLYAGEIRYLDHALGRLLRRLRTDDSKNDPVILLTADHGEEFLEHGWFGHTKHMYEETLRVPLIAVGPAGRSPALRDDAATLLDVFPTLLSVAGGGRDRFTGRDLFGSDRSRRPLYAEVRFDRDLETRGNRERERGRPRKKTDSERWKRIELDQVAKQSDQRSVTLDDWKAIEDRRSGTWQLFHLGDDPGETRDRAAEEPEVLARLQAAVPDLDAIERFEADAAVDVSAEEVETLKALGYVR